MNNFLLKKNKIFNNNQITDIIEKGFKNFDLENADYYILEDLIEYSNLTDIIILKILIPVLLCLLNSLNTGSLCLNLDNPELINKLNNLTDNINESKKIIFDFIKNIDLFNGIISIDKDEYKPLVLKTYNKKKIPVFSKIFYLRNKIKRSIEQFFNP